MHKAISLFFLFRYCRGSLKPLVQTLIDVMKDYCLGAAKTDDKQSNLRRTYRRVRQLCYLAIDSLYSPVSMSISLGSILFNLERVAPHLVSPSDSAFSRELDSFNELMVREVYLRPEVLLQHEAQALHTAKYIDQQYSTRVGEAVRLRRHEISDMRKLLLRLQDGVGSAGRDSHDRILYLPVVPGDLFRPTLSAEDLKARLEDACGKRHVGISAVADARHGGAHVAVGMPTAGSRREMLRCFAGLVQEMCLLVEGGIPDQVSEDYRVFARCLNSVATDCAPEIAQGLLGFLANWSRQFSVGRQRAFVAYPGEGSRENGAALVSISRLLQSSQREHEVGTHAAALGEIGARGRVMSFVAPIMVTDASGRRVTDIDGLSMVCKSGGVWVLLVEGKDQRVGSGGASARQLSRRVADMGLRESLGDPTPIVLRGRGAYVFAQIR